MPTVADCLRQHAPAYLQSFGPDSTKRLPPGHRKVLGAITRCRTGELGGVVYRCDDCKCHHWAGRSCGNRHCPNCQKHKTRAWLAQQTDRLLPVHHFLVTVTVPAELRPVLRGDQKNGYDALFNSGSQMIRGLLENPRYLGTSKVGFFGVLHTWGRDPTVYHPHVHFVVPGGGVSEDGTKWLATPENFLFPHARAIALYKKRFAQALRKNALYDQVPPSAWLGKWVVDIRPVGDGRAVLKYLAPYVYRVAISDNRILDCDAQSVTFGYTPSGNKQSKIRRVTGSQFVRGFLQHVLPRGLQKVRYYGWMSPNCRIALDLVKWLVWLYRGWTFWLASGAAPQEPPLEKEPLRCATCGSSMRIVGQFKGDWSGQVAGSQTLIQHARSYLDSG